MKWALLLGGECVVEESEENSSAITETNNPTANKETNPLSNMEGKQDAMDGG